MYLRTRLSLIVVGLLLGSLLGSLCYGAAIDFDDVEVTAGVGWTDWDHYRDIGVLFSHDLCLENVGLGEPGFQPTFELGGGTEPNGLALSYAACGHVIIEATFVIPGTDIPTTADVVTADAFDAQVGTSLGTLEAYDAEDNLIASDTQTTPTCGYGSYQVTGPGIARLKIIQDSDGGLFDNFYFQLDLSPVEMAEPVCVLHPAFPNPFNPRTTIAFDVPQAMAVDLCVYDAAGRCVVALLDDEVVRAGRNEVAWQGRDRTGRRLASGTYFCRLQAGGSAQMQRMTLLK